MRGKGRRPLAETNGQPDGGGSRRSRKLGSVLLAVGILIVAFAASIALIGSLGSLRGQATTPIKPATPVTPAVTATARAATQPPPPLVTVPVATPAPTPRQAVKPASTPRRATTTPPPKPAATPAPKRALPQVTRIAIPAVGINTKVVQTGYQITRIDGKSVMQWQVADFAAGHAALSAEPGGGGNIVIAGHDDWKGEVFKNLHQAKLGQQVILTTPAKTYRYVITEIHYRKAIGASLADRLAAGQFLAPMPQERVTLVTCWPYGVDSYRLIVVAKPVSS